MYLKRILLAVSLLVISSQSSALFMPTGFQVNSGAEVVSTDSSDGGC
jgi:hypothetical protein